MKHARKMILVDYDQYMSNQSKSDLNIDPKPLRVLDEEMFNTLNRGDISTYEKNELFKSKLNKYLFFIEQSKKNQNFKKSEQPSHQEVKKEENLKIKPDVKTEVIPHFTRENDVEYESDPDFNVLFDLFTDDKNNVITSPQKPITVESVNDDLRRLTDEKNKLFDNTTSELPKQTPKKRPIGWDIAKTPSEKQKNKKKPVQRSPVVLRPKNPANPSQKGGWISFNKINQVYKQKFQ